MHQKLIEVLNECCKAKMPKAETYLQLFVVAMHTRTSMLACKLLIK